MAKRACLTARAALTADSTPQCLNDSIEQIDRALVRSQAGWQRTCLGLGQWDYRVFKP